MEYLQSNKNSTIKDIKSLQQRKNRDSKGLFFIEGLRFVKEAFDLQEQIEMVVVSERLLEESESALLVTDVEAKGIKCIAVPDKLFCEISDTQTPQGIMAVMKKQKYDLSSTIEKSSFVVVLDSLQDPGNLGTILRTADAAGADCIILSKGCVDIYSPKVLRATMGSIFHVPVIDGIQIEEALQTLKAVGHKIVASHLAGVNNYFETELTAKTTIVIGNEANGISDITVKQADILVKIPMPGKAESLNAAIAAAVMMYEVTRQRMLHNIG